MKGGENVMGRYAIYGVSSSSESSGRGRSSASENPGILSIPEKEFTNEDILNTKTPINIEEIEGYDISDANKLYNNTIDLEDTLTKLSDEIHKSIGIRNTDSQQQFTEYTRKYNRFKIPTLNDAFVKGFAHVFFLRPDCNIINNNSLNSKFKDNPIYNYAWKNSPSMVKELVLDNGLSHDFMLSLSNKAASFSLSDEYIDSDFYGKTYRGNKIGFGRNDVESKTGGDFSVTYNDDRTLHIYHLHKLWVDYISGVFQGRYYPKQDYVMNKILDYASACYYIVTAEDGETIIFWSKYYGVFPTTIPSTQYSWGYGNLLEKPTLDIKYVYSFKEDFNPMALVEFNANANVNGSMKYEPIFNPNWGHAGNTWVGAPYIELVTDNTDPSSPYTFKLRFRPY